MKKELTRLFSVLLAAVLVFGTLPVSAMGTDVADPPASAVDDTAVDESVAEPEEQSAEAENVALQAANDASYDYNIFFLDCGRKYYSVDSIKQLIDNASAAGFNYIQLAVGNDGLRFLLDDMSLTVNGKDYGSDDVKAAIHEGNEAYCNFDVDELTQSVMDTIIAYANSKNMGVIPCVNTPGHMDAILAAATSLTGTNCAYNGSVRTIDVTNTTAVAFTQALLQKYINYFAGKGCQLFNMGADEYANDKYTTGSMGFGQLQSAGKYSYYVTYVNEVAEMIKNAGMKPMAFNDGIYFKDVTSSGTFDTDIIICYWSCGFNQWYKAMSASDLASKGFKLINTNGTYYWIVGGNKCSVDTAKGFNYKTFSGGTIDNPSGSMFCIWADDPDSESEEAVISGSADTIAAFGSTLPDLKEKLTVSVGDSTEAIAATKLGVGGEQTLTASKSVEWTVEDENVVSLTPVSDVATYSASVTAKAVTAKAEGVGETTITVTDPNDPTVTASVNVSVQEMTEETITIAAGQEKTITVSGQVTPETVADPATASVTAVHKTGTSTKVNETPVTSIESGKKYIIQSQRSGAILTAGYTNNQDWKYNLMVLSSDNAIADSKDIWTLTSGSSTNSFTAASASSTNTNQYLNITRYNNTNASAAVSTTEQQLTFSYNSTDAYWQISGRSQNSTYYLNAFGAAGKYAGGYNVSGDDGNKWSIYEVVTTETDETELTFEGLEEGETTVVIGSVTYTIKVLPAALGKVDPLEIQYWITNTRVTAEGSNSKKFDAVDVYSENGKALSELIPTEGTSAQGHPTELWKGTRLTSNNKQTAAEGDDKTLSGDDFSYIRYWDNSWSFSADGKTWTPFDDGDQIVAYYMQRTEVTEEITTDVVDWGDNYGSVDWRGDGSYDTVELDFAVKYENGYITPTSFPVYESGSDTDTKTMEFHAHSDTKDEDGNKYRRIGRINAVETKDYEVYMITLTPTSDDVTDKLYNGNTNRPKSYQYKGTEKAVWVDDVANLGDFASDDKKAKQFKVGGEPSIEYIDIYARQGMLVTYYVRAKVTADSLAVRYVDKNLGTEFYNYNIAVAQGTFFDKNIGLNNPWKGDLLNGTVTNLQKNDITVSSDLSTMPAIGAAYKYAGYTCDEVELSNDQKTVTLYYTFSKTASFVIDFGTPFTITPKDINGDLANANIEKVNVTSVTHGSVTYGSDYSFTYTPNADFVKDEKGETLQVTYTGTKTADNGETVTDTVTYQVYIYPASNVLYEENFLSTTETRWKPVEKDHSAAQETQKAKTTGNVFGYDANASASGANGYWQMSDLDKKNDLGAALTTEFYGNAFDLIGNCGKDTGRVLIAITNQDDTTTRAKLIDVDTRYAGNTLYQVPLAHAVMDADAHYKVDIYATKLAATTSTPRGVATYASEVSEDDEFLNQVLDAYGLSIDDVDYISTSAADTVNEATNTPNEATFYSAVQAADGSSVNHEAGTHVEIDGFRVYRSTTDTVAESAYPENEMNVAYTNILKAVGNTIVEAYTENGTVTNCAVKDYEKMGGPQNEIYLEKGQSVTIQVSGAETIQVSMRAVNGSATWNKSNTISVNTEMYYTVAKSGDAFTITNTGEDLLALGNVKIPDGAVVTTAKEMDADVILASVRATYGNTSKPDPDPDPEPDPEPETFQPTTFTVNDNVTKVIRNKVVTLKIKVSDDVAYVTVNGVKYTRSGLQSSFQKTRTIRVMNTIPRNAEKTYEIIAYNADGVASEAVTKTVK